MQKPHQKILFLAEVMNFLNLAHNTITIRVQTLKTTLGTFFEKTIQARGLKLGSYVPLKGVSQGSLNKYFFRYLWPKMGLIKM